MSGPAGRVPMSEQDEELLQLTLQLRNNAEQEKYAKFHGDKLIGNTIVPQTGYWEDIKSVVKLKNLPGIKHAIGSLVDKHGLDDEDRAFLGGNVPNTSAFRQKGINAQVKEKYDKMLHPPLTYLGDAFQYRTADGKFNSAMNPHLGQAGAPYAKTVPSQTAPLGALPDPSDLFDKLMARPDGGRDSKSGLSAMLIYHATIIIHDIFRTNDNDKNISDSSSYLDLSPLYGYTTEMQRKIRDDKYKLGLLKPDTFAEDRLLRQPPGVCIMLVMYNRYHNYAARQLLRINENGRFQVPAKYQKTKLVSFVMEYLPDLNENGQKKDLDREVLEKCEDYEKAWRAAQAAKPREAPAAIPEQPGETPDQKKEREDSEKRRQEALDAIAEFEKSKVNEDLEELEEYLEDLLEAKNKDYKPTLEAFGAAWQAAWDKLDDDLFNTARLITCGMYIQISVHDYLRALMGFHQFNTNFTLDPRADFDQKKTSRGIGNQVTVEFNLLYRFHCAISQKDERYTIEYMKKVMNFKNPNNTTLPEFMQTSAAFSKKIAEEAKRKGRKAEPWEVTFGIPDKSKQTPAVGSNSSAPSEDGSDSGISGVATPETAEKAEKFRYFTRNPITNLFDDRLMLDELTAAMDDPISNFGPRNVPKCLKSVEIMGIMQSRKWGTGTLNDFRDFFGLPRHATFESVTKNPEIQNALRDLYEHPDMIELYPGIFCESDQDMGLDPGPAESSSALWTAIFSDAITLVRSDRFYTVDWNTNSLTSWGMKEVTPNNDVCKSSVFHRLLQRAFPGWFPADTIRFFHPFYTAEQNEIYAKAQGFAGKFRETVTGKEPTVQKPKKPLSLHTFKDISTVLQDKSENFTNPVYTYKSSLPSVVNAVLDPRLKAPEPSNDLEDYVTDVEEDLKKYLDGLMREIVKRESISMTTETFQIDATKDFAIPVVTRYVADFLGFSDKLSKLATEAKDTYSENEIYQHITNCQVFLSYNADETKWMQRREAFQTSMKTLITLTQKGTIWEANQWDITRAFFGRKKTNAMHDLGVYVAKMVLGHQKDQAKAAAILLLVCLDFAYNAVVSFTATLDGYMKDLYKAADSKPVTLKWTPKWIGVQTCAFKNNDEELERVIQLMVQETVKLPIVRKATKTDDYTFQSTKETQVTVEDGDIVILDISKAMKEADVQSDKAKKDLLASQLTIADKYGVYSPRRFATLSLTSMIKFIAQMKNPRRGHDAQGRLKRIRLDSTPEGYANYMAPMRVNWIKQQAQRLEDKNAVKKIVTEGDLRPAADTYLTVTWDEFVPFPMTWKIRFDGFGQSDYKVGNHPYGRVTTVRTLPDYMPPMYQPQGASTFGGAFATPGCACSNAGCSCLGPSTKKTKLEHEHETPQLATGCGMGDSIVQKD